MAGPLDPDNLPTGTQVGFYRVVRRVGAGGFGTLYEVERDGKTYALKLSRERLGSMSPVDRARFEDRTDREIAAVKQFSHPNIVKVQATDRYPDLETGHPYLVMDFVKGEELRKWCASHAPSPAAICGVFEKLARAVDYMHRRQVFHRDLKSENVLVRDDGDPVIIDFGVSRGRTSFRLTRHETMVGTESHWAPEYLRHRETEAYERGEEFQWTPATDLHAVGYMLYEALTGGPPFQPDDKLERLWKAIQKEVPPRPSGVNPAVPRLLDAVVMRLLEKDPQERHHSGQELAEELRTLVERHGQKQEWSQPLPIPAPAAAAVAARTVVRTVAAASSDPDLANIDALDESPIALAAAKMVRQVAADQGPAAPPTGGALPGQSTTSASGAERAASAASVKSKVEHVRNQVARAVSEHRVRSRPLLVGGVAIALLLLASVVVAASQRREPQKPTSLVAKVARESGKASPALTPPQPAMTYPAARAAAGPISSAPSAIDARAIDRELEARYGGRPTVKADGTITTVQPPRGANDAAAPFPTLAASMPSPVIVNAATPPEPAAPTEPAWLKRSTRLDRKVLVAQQASAPPKALGIPTGSHIPARLLTTLDSRTVGNGPVEARLSRPFVVRGEVVLAAGTLAFGRASATDGRFVVRFDRLRLPDDRELEFAALAMDREDARPGLAASRRIAGERRGQGEGVGVTIARSSAETVLGTVAGGLTQDLVREAGHVALQPRAQESSGSTDVEILDPGVVFDLWVEKPF